MNNYCTVNNSIITQGKQKTSTCYISKTACLQKEYHDLLRNISCANILQNTLGHPSPGVSPGFEMSASKILYGSLHCRVINEDATLTHFLNHGNPLLPVYLKSTGTLYTNLFKGRKTSL